MEKLRVLSLFSGIGAFEKALTNLGIPYELVNAFSKAPIPLNKLNTLNFSIFYPLYLSPNPNISFLYL